MVLQDFRNLIFSTQLLRPQVFNLLRGHDESCRGTRHLMFLGFPICNRGFCKLLGIGKGRFSTLSKSVKEGSLVAPTDGRFFPKGPCKQSHKRSLVYDFLHQLWLTTGESLPDSGHSSSRKRPRQQNYRFDSKAADKKQVRHLPPGKFADYHRLCVAEHPDAQISRKLFISATRLSFINVFSFNPLAPMFLSAILS